MVHIVPFGVKKIGKYGNKNIIRFSHERALQMTPEKGNLYICTPHTFNRLDDMKPVIEHFKKFDVEFQVEVVWDGFIKSCKQLGLKWLPSFYELGIEIDFPKCGKELYPTHFGRSVFYETLNLKNLQELYPFAKHWHDKYGQKMLLTAARLKNDYDKPRERLLKGHPYLDLKTNKPQKWLPEIIAHVGCNVSATQADAGPRLFTYAARMGIGTVFFRDMLAKRMGQPLDILKPYTFIANSFEPEEIERVVQKARKFRGQQPITRKQALQPILDGLKRNGIDTNKVEFFK